MTVKFQRLTKTATLPEQAHKTDAGYDLHADIDKPVLIRPHTTVKIPTGLAMAIPEGYWGGIFARSGAATKRGLAPANKVGVIDCSYRGELIVALHNHSEENQVVDVNERIAQLVLIPCLYYDIEEVDSLSETERGTGGFGSSGTI